MMATAGYHVNGSCDDIPVSFHLWASLGAARCPGDHPSVCTSTIWATKIPFSGAVLTASRWASCQSTYQE